MFIHIGKGQIVFKDELIGIFKMNVRDNPINKEFLESENAENLYRHSDLKRYKSFVVTDNALLFSPIIPTTLAHRESRSI